MTNRNYTFFDQMFGHLDNAMRTVLGPSPASGRTSPAVDLPESAMSASERELSARLMRINHAGEVCAQALYQGQAMTARLPQVRGKMEQAAREESDHLAWTEERIRELGGHASYLNPLWYASSFAIGALAGILGDKWSLGFVAETEKQVVHHLEGHLQRLPPGDRRSRAILEQMRDDEGRHATVAIESGGAELPPPLRRTMGCASKVMTNTAYWF